MRKPLVVRDLSQEEQIALKAGLRSFNARVVRRCQIVFASASKLHAKAFNTNGLDILTPASTRPHRTRDQFSDQTRAQLGRLIYQSPRAFGKETSVWTLELLAQVAFAQGYLSVW